MHFSSQNNPNCAFVTSLKDQKSFTKQFGSTNPTFAVDVTDADLNARKFAIQVRSQVFCSIMVAMAAPEINMKAVGVITNIMKTRLLILVATQPDMENLLASLQVKALLITGNHIENLSYKVKSTKIKKVSRLVLFI